MEGELEVKHGQRLQSENKRSLLEVGVKVHLLWLEDPRSGADTRAARPPPPQLLYTEGLKGN